MLSIHGLIRAKNPELGRDADTGGQVTYVLEMGRALAAQEEVSRVYLFTRQIYGKNISSDYQQPFEKVCDKFFIVRIPFGPKRYLHKESLWPHLTEFVDNTLSWLCNKRIVPDIIHGNYADAGWASVCLSSILRKPHIFTGHSLGRVKLQGLLSSGMTYEEAEQKYRISTRIKAEEISLNNAKLVISSTDDEKEKQYSLYNHYNPSCIRVIAPGINLKRFYPSHVVNPKTLPIWKSICRFLIDPQKPIILVVCRPDYKKNTKAIINVYAKSPRLKEKANLVLFLGVRKDIEKMPKNSKEVLKEILLEIDKHNLYGKVAYPKDHLQEDIPQIYRMATKSYGVFVHPALEENFGLTLIEAASCGLPLVATKVGGPFAIVNTCQNGILVDPLNEEEIERAIWEILSDRKKWKQYSENGIRNVHRHYTWESFIKRYLYIIKPLNKNVQIERRFENTMLCKKSL